MILISSLHHDDAIDKSTDEKCKPEIITFYNHTKGGVDTLDKLSATYDVSRNTRRWPMVVFYAMMNMAGVNSQIIYASNNKLYSITRRFYLRDLALSLTRLFRTTFVIDKCTTICEREKTGSGWHFKHKCASRNSARDTQKMFFLQKGF